MSDWLDTARTYLEKPYILGLAIVLASIIAAFLAEHIIYRSLAAAAAKTKTQLDDKIIAALRRPIYFSILLYGIYWAVEIQSWHPGAVFPIYGGLKTALAIVWATVAFRIGSIFLHALSDRAGTHSILQQRTLPLFNMVLKGTTFAIGVYFVFLSWDIDVTAWLASAGIIGIAFGFAAQDTLSNLFAGIFIIADAPYKIGDYIVLDDGTRGCVTRIGMRSTRVLTLDDVEITIPNSVIGGSKIVNEAGGPHLKQRITVSVDAAYGSDVDQVRDILLSCVDGVEGISRSPTPETRFLAFGASGLNFQLLVWIDNPADRDDVLNLLHEKVYKGFNEAGVEIPYSKHDLYLKEMPGGMLPPGA